MKRDKTVQKIILALAGHDLVNHFNFYDGVTNVLNPMNETYLSMTFELNTYKVWIDYRNGVMYVNESFTKNVEEAIEFINEIMVVDFEIKIESE